MKKIFEEYGMFFLAVIAGIMCITIFLALFIGDGSAVGPMIGDFIERLI